MENLNPKPTFKIKLEKTASGKIVHSFAIYDVQDEETAKRLTTQAINSIQFAINESGNIAY